MFLCLDKHIVTDAEVTIVLNPGLGDVRATYRFLIPLLQAQGRVNVVNCDLRGMSDRVSSAEGTSVVLDVDGLDFSTDASAKDILKVVDTICPPGVPVVLVGCSMSGACVASAAAERPGRVAGVVLLNPFLEDKGMNPIIQFLLWSMLREWIGPWFWTSYYRSLYTMRPSTVPDLDEYCKQLKQTLVGRMHVVRSHAFASKTPCTDKLPALVKAGTPVLALWGSKDPDFPSPADEARHVEVDLLGQASGGSRITSVLVEGVGHYPHAEKPQEVSERIREFLARLKEGKKADSRGSTVVV
jgi:pimeloyl-ACP methyl ester carboxylesterase